MNRHLLPLAAIVSACVGLILSIGWIAHVGVDVDRKGAPAGTDASVELAAYDGALFCRWWSSPASPTSTRASADTRWRVVRRFEFRKLHADHLLGRFGAHTLGDPASPYAAGVVGVPLWCLELPLLIAPAAWFFRRRRRQQRKRTGFPALTRPAE